MRVLMAAMAMSVVCGQALASGGIACGADDDNVLIRLDGGVSRGMGSALFSFDGEVHMRGDGVAADLAETKFGRGEVAQYWLDEDGLKLRLYRERAGNRPHGYVELIVDAPSGENAEGNYRVEVYDMEQENDGEAATASLSGSIRCIVE